MIKTKQQGKKSDGSTAINRIFDDFGDDDDLFSEFENTETTYKVPRITARPPRNKEKDPEPGKKIRYNLLLEPELNSYLRGIVWKKRTNMTKYVNDLIRADKEAYEKACEKKGEDPYNGWVD